MSKFQRWVDIEGFAQALKSYSHQHHRLGRVSFVAKPKIHGTNAAINISPTGITYQSRNNVISSKNDNFGFATYFENFFGLEGLYEYRLSLSEEQARVIIHGEWAGPDIIKGTSVSRLPRRVFFIFAVEKITPTGRHFIIAPENIEAIIPSSLLSEPNIKIIPFYDLMVSFNVDNMENVNEAMTAIQQAIDIFETTDPYINPLFGVEGNGEGLVFYPVDVTDGAYTVPDQAVGYNLLEMIFKAKTKAHQVNATGFKVSATIAKVEDTRAFAEMFVTDARIQQALSENNITNPAKRDFSVLIPWVIADIKKESVHELEENSELSWKDVSSVCGALARQKIEKLMIPPSGVVSQA